MAIAYPLHGKYAHSDFSNALASAQKRVAPVYCYAIGPDFPAEFNDRIIERDRYYILAADAPIPKKLVNPVRKAAQILEVRESMAFTPAHRRLWAEFLENRGRMPDRVAGLYTRAPTALAEAGGSLRLLDAIDPAGNITASLLLDYAPEMFVSYVIGAHSRKFYAPHAADLLFAAMLANARKAGKRFIHLGLGVNDGILRFKRKWGAKAYYPYLYAQWQPTAADSEDNVIHALATAFLRSDAGSGQKIIEDHSPKPFAMLWEARKKDRVSWIGGTAHFFCHSFEASFRKLFRNVDHVIFEGPLDAEFMAQVDSAGKSREVGTPALDELLSETEILRLEKTVMGPRGRLAASLGMQARVNIDVRWLLANARPWCAFFTCWTSFLERQGWHESVDMEAWRIAREVGKNVVGMESLEEQLESLGSLPVERVLRFFRNCNAWKAHARRNHHAYLAGDLEGMMGSSAEFPTRTEHVIGRRDQRFRERMRPYLEAGRSAVFVGSAHMVNLRHMLAEDGFSIRQVPFGIWPKLHYHWRRLTRPDERVTW